MILHAIEAGSGAGQGEGQGTGQGAGQGPPALLLHGLFGQGRNLGVVQRRFAHRRMIAMDLRNHGGSPHAPGMSYAAMAEDVRETARAIGAWPAILVGHSMGGKVAMRLALDCAPEVLGVVAMDIAPVRYAPRFQSVVAAMRAVPGALGRREADAVLAETIPDAAFRGFLLQNYADGAWRLGIDAIADGLSAIEDFDARGRYDGPALFIAGTRSSYVRPAHQMAIDALFPSARMAACDTGHWLHAEDPACVCAHLAEFFEVVDDRVRADAGRGFA